MQRRSFFAHALAAGSAAVAAPTGDRLVPRIPGSRPKIGLNAYSFNRPLSAGKMTLADVVDYCARQGVDELDATGYYFTGYPKPPSDDAIFALKRRAYFNGVTIGGTGVRNDFALPSAEERKPQIQLVKDWIEVTAKLGAGFVRVFSGRQIAPGYTFDQTLEWMVPAFQECCEHGRKYGVVVAVQHHWDALKTAEETIRLADRVNHEWFSVVLDVGSLRRGDPYAEIEKLIPYSCTWQIKEQVWYGDQAKPIDLPRLKALIDKTGFRGFAPIEALGPGDPEQVVTAFLDKVRKAFASS